MHHRMAITVAAFMLSAPPAFAQTAVHAAPPEEFKFLSAQGVVALTDKPGPGAKTDHLVDHESYTVEYVARNDAGNLAEVHTHWTHYISMLEGEGTLTYGGTVSNAKVTGPGQLRGDAITGGTTIALHVGDYLQIPAGTPHLFNPKPGTKMRYLVFNARQ
jgi:quercetin dioxygenase-like cupin family protein